MDTNVINIVDVDTAFELIMLEELLAMPALDPTAPLAYYYR